MKKKLIIYMEMAAILKIINEPNVFGSSTSRPLGFYTGCVFTNTLLSNRNLFKFLISFLMQFLSMDVKTKSKAVVSLSPPLN